MKKFLLLTVFFFLCNVFIKAQIEMPPDIQQWYDAHVIFMEKSIPNSEMLEKDYFVRLSTDLKKQYINLFWKMRSPGLEEEYNLRVDYITMNLLESDMARIYLLCGEPKVKKTQKLTDTTSTIINTLIIGTRDTQSKQVEIWGYELSPGMVLRYVFEQNAETGKWKVKGSYDDNQARDSYENSVKVRWALISDSWKTLWQPIMNEYYDQLKKAREAAALAAKKKKTSVL
jgi:hypothetical protein